MFELNKSISHLISPLEKIKCTKLNIILSEIVLSVVTPISNIKCDYEPFLNTIPSSIELFSYTIYFINAPKRNTHRLQISIVQSLNKSKYNSEYT